MPRTFRQRHEPRHDVRIWFGQLASSLVLAIHVAGLGLVASCAETPLGPSISGRDYSTDVDTDASGGVTSGDQPDDDAAGSDDDLVPVDTDTDTDTDTATDTDTDTDVAVGLACAETSTQNVWYPGATVSQTVTCDDDVASTTVNTALPAWLSLATSLPDSILTFTGTAGAAATTNWNLTYTSAAGGFDAVTVQSRVLATTPTFNADATITLTDDTAGTADVSATLDAAYDGAGGTLKPLMSNTSAPATTSNGTVAWSASDVPQLTYTDGVCGVAVTPYICADTGAASATTPTSTFEMRWDWDIFDQGTYEVRTQGYLDVDGADVYSSNVDTTTFTVADQGGELAVIAANTRIGNTNFKSPTAWQSFRPAIAMNDTLSSQDAEVFGVVYAANNGNRHQWGGVITLDRDVSTTALSNDWFDPTDTNTRFSAAGNNAESMTMAAAAGADEWITIGGHNGAGGSRNLVLNVLDYGGGTPSKTLLAITSLADGSLLYNVAMTDAFDDGGTMRHGVAFFGSWDPVTANTQHLYVTKIASNPLADTVPGFFDAGAWYDTTGNDLSGTVDSVPVTTVDQNAVLSLVKIVNGTVGATDYFYVGWRNETTGNLAFARVEASSAGDPAIVQTAAGGVITDMDGANSAVLGRPDYAIASGEDEDGNDILGVIYAQDDSGNTTCRFQAYEHSGGELVELGTPHLVGAAITDCRFPHLWYNTGTGKFMAVLVDGTTFDTSFFTFIFDADADALSPAAPSAVLMTNRAVEPCLFAATYSPTWYRIGTLSMDGTCSGTTADSMYFDIYKPER